MSQQSDSSVSKPDMFQGPFPDVVLLQMGRGVGQWRLRNGFSARVRRRLKRDPDEAGINVFCSDVWEGDFTDHAGKVVATFWREDGTNGDDLCGFDLVAYERPLGPDPQKFNVGCATSKPKKPSLDIFPECRPLNSTNDVPTGSPHWYISFNPSAAHSGYGCITTAVVIGQCDICWVLCGDHREALKKTLREKPEGLSGLVYAMQYVRNNADKLHSFSDPC